jgi:hypothetical protein
MTNLVFKTSSYTIVKDNTVITDTRPFVSLMFFPILLIDALLVICDACLPSLFVAIVWLSN